MSDFVVWLSPMPVPRLIRRRWNWSDSRVIATRRHRFRDIGRCRSDETGSELVFVGHGRGARGRRRFPSSDTLASQLLEAVESRGTEGLDDFLGPVAGAWIDADGRRAVVWRDRFGRQPLQMIRLPSGWAVTTSPEVTARQSRSAPRKSNASHFIHGAPSHSDADVFEDVFRIRPAEVVHFEDKTITGRHQWWTPRRQTAKQPDESMRELLHELGGLYGRKPHILALSGGLDSATLGAFISRRHPASEAVTFADPDSSHNEMHTAGTVASSLGLRWSPFSIADHWPLSRRADHRFPVAWGPPSHPDSAWKFPCYRWLARRRPHLPVMYGNGADAALWFPPRLWLESRWYRGDWPSLAEASRHLPMSRFLRAGAGTALDTFGLQFLRDLMPHRPSEGAVWESPQRWIDAPSVSQQPPRNEPPARRFIDQRLRRLGSWRWERVMRFLAFEARRADRPLWTPFLDAEFWELSLSLRPEHLVEGGRQKAILRRITARLLPEECRQRPKFGGFDAVVERGLAVEASRAVYRLFARPALDDWSIFRPKRFLEAYEAYRRARRGPARFILGSWAIWRTVATELWLRRRHHRPLYLR